MEQTRTCRLCKAPGSDEEFWHARGKCFSKFCPKCRKELRNKEERARRRKDAAPGPCLEEHAETCRVCKVCEKEKPIEGFRTTEGKYRLRTCKVCQGIKERAYRWRNGRAVQYAYAKAHPRKPIPKEERAERMRRYRATPFGKLTDQMVERRRWIRRSTDKAKIARWKDEIRQMEAMRQRIRNDLSCQQAPSHVDRPGQLARF
jgi:hypothetical protein